MPNDRSGVTVDVVPAESSRFRHSLLFLHGLWTGAWIWRDFSAYLAHRGWDSLAPSFLTEADALDADARLRALSEICRDLPAPPIIVGHEAGAATGAAFARTVGAPAIVTIVPLEIAAARVLGEFSPFDLLWARTFARRVRPPRGRGPGTPLDELGHRVDRLVPDSGRFFRTVVSGRTRQPNATDCPRLVVGSTRDLADSSASRAAQLTGATVDVHETAGYFPMFAPGWERLADYVHRWLVQTIGADLLAWIDDDETPA